MATCVDPQYFVQHIFEVLLYGSVFKGGHVWVCNFQKADRYTLIEHSTEVCYSNRTVSISAHSMKRSSHTTDLILCGRKISMQKYCFN